MKIVLTALKSVPESGILYCGSLDAVFRLLELFLELCQLLILLSLLDNSILIFCLQIGVFLLEVIDAASRPLEVALKCDHTANKEKNVFVNFGAVRDLASQGTQPSEFEYSIGKPPNLRLV